tara:strand:+ start:815 stop:1051 length:237 start_codon:yes stop_codon:yes gene_type:complete
MNYIIESTGQPTSITDTSGKYFKINSIEKYIENKKNKSNISNLYKEYSLSNNLFNPTNNKLNNDWNNRLLYRLNLFNK